VRTAGRAGIGLVVPGDDGWPVGLADLDRLVPGEGSVGGAPVCLWVRGRLPPAVAAPPAVAVVGARAATAYGEHVAGDLSASLVSRGWTVVSGAAYGIDASAHRGALAAAEEGTPPTVAVLAGGVDRASPAGHEQLLHHVVEAGGAVVSEQCPGTRPAAYRFLLRNRLIAAWGRGVVVVEASLRSGALNTARTAADLSRHVAVVPGPVTSATSAGSNRLLRDGASCVCDADDVVDLLGALGTAPLWQEPVAVALDRTGATPVHVERLGPDAARVWQALGARGGRSVEQLVADAGLGHRAVATALGLLELHALVSRDGAARRRDGTAWRRGGTDQGGPVVVP
jgi:DNA processing protein